ALDATQSAAKVGLASAFYQQGKTSAALVIVEDLAKSPTPPPRALLLHARLALKAGEPRLAAQQYAAARDRDPNLMDAALETELAPYLPKRPTPTLPNTVTSAEEEEDISAFSDSDEPDEDEDREALPAGDLPGETAADEPE